MSRFESRLDRAKRLNLPVAHIEEGKREVYYDHCEKIDGSNQSVPNYHHPKFQYLGKGIKLLVPGIKIHAVESIEPDHYFWELREWALKPLEVELHKSTDREKPTLPPAEPDPDDRLIQILLLRDQYKARIKTATLLIDRDERGPTNRKTRITAKKSAYKTIVTELNKIIDNNG